MFAAKLPLRQILNQARLFGICSGPQFKYPLSQHGYNKLLNLNLFFQNRLFSQSNIFRNANNKEFKDIFNINFGPIKIECTRSIVDNIKKRLDWIINKYGTIDKFLENNSEVFIRDPIVYLKCHVLVTMLILGSYGIVASNYDTMIENFNVIMAGGLGFLGSMYLLNCSRFLFFVMVTMICMGIYKNYKNYKKQKIENVNN